MKKKEEMDKKSPDRQKTASLFQVMPLGETSIVLKFGNSISPQVLNKIQGFSACLRKNPFRGLIELVPAYTTLTIYYNPWILSGKGKYNPFNRVKSIVRELALKQEKEGELQGRQIDIPVCYGGEFGPDLETVAKHHQLSPEEVINIHSAGEYLVYMLGFMPGFPYLGGLDERIACPRKTSPRALVPAGSVGIAGIQTGIYPLTSPGGWQLIGRTPLVLFNPERHPAALLQAGDRLRFVPISREEYLAGKEGAHES